MLRLSYVITGSLLANFAFSCKTNEHTSELKLNNSPRAIPESVAEITYAACKETVRYYFGRVDKALAKVSEPNVVKGQITASGVGYFWTQPQDPTFLPNLESPETGPTMAFVNPGSYLSPQKVTCDLDEGTIQIDMLAKSLVGAENKEVTVKQRDIFTWDAEQNTFLGKVDFSADGVGTYFQFEGLKFNFVGCNNYRLECSSIDILFPIALPPGEACVAQVSNFYGFAIPNSEEVVACRATLNNLNYFAGNPEKVVGYAMAGEELIVNHLQVVNDISVFATYTDGQTIRYDGVDCYLQFTSDSRQNWDNREFRKDLCLPEKATIVSQ